MEEIVSALDTEQVALGYFGGPLGYFLWEITREDLREVATPFPLLLLHYITLQSSLTVLFMGELILATT